MALLVRLIASIGELIFTLTGCLLLVKIFVPSMHFDVA